MPWRRGLGGGVCCLGDGDKGAELVALETGIRGRSLLPWRRGKGAELVAMETELGDAPNLLPAIITRLLIKFFLVKFHCLFVYYWSEISASYGSLAPRIFDSLALLNPSSVVNLQ